MADSWGYICPIDTPDGSLCGILNHLTKGALCQISQKLDNKINLKQFLIEQSYSSTQDLQFEKHDKFLDIIFNGEIIGFQNKDSLT